MTAGGKRSPHVGSVLAVLVLALVWLGCPGESDLPEATREPGADLMRGFAGDGVFEVRDELLTRRSAPRPERRALFGDLHVHTTYSFDAYAFGTVATPADAYRYARGEAILHPAGFQLQLRQPLDFYAVTDHAMFLGVAREAGDTSTEFSKQSVAEPLNELNAPDNRGFLSLAERVQAFSSFLPSLLAAIQEGVVEREEVLDIGRTAWRDTVEAADLFNDPGRFTTFVAFEYTSSTDDRGNLHRNVIFEDSSRLPALPFSRFHSQNPEGLWDWMDGLRAQGIESLAIPHNSNGSNGQMFKWVDWAGEPIDDAYARRRIRNEPLAEITQIKGTSETHPLLSSRDEWADFEIMPYRVATMLPSEPAGGYLRDALRRGLTLESRGITNPYAFGFIGSSDSHTGATSDDESNFFSKIGLLDATPELRGSVPLSFLPAVAIRFAAPELSRELDGETYVQAATPTYGASGLAGVWAEENTRASIYAALRRKETFGTSGPRIQVRFFAGYELGEDLLGDSEFVPRAYVGGVPMGSRLAARAGETPRFLLWALADAQSAALQRLQVVKGWVDAEGESFEVVYDVACSDGGIVNSQTQRCTDNGARVDPSSCAISAELGSPQLKALWKDPDFDPDQRAFYYARVLENPTCRWSTWDAIRTGVPPRSDLPATIQERAWSSPIHYRPG